MIAYPFSGGGSSAGSTVTQASGENDGMSTKMLAIVGIGAYAVYKVMT